jgi:hypothetical protein
MEVLIIIFESWDKKEKGARKDYSFGGIFFAFRRIFAQ